MKSIDTDLAELKAGRLLALKRRGFDYAAGRLLKDGHTALAALKQQVSMARDFGSYNEFDKGIEEAIAKFKEFLNNEVMPVNSAKEASKIFGDKPSPMEQLIRFVLNTKHL